MNRLIFSIVLILCPLCQMRAQILQAVLSDTHHSASGPPLDCATNAAVNAAYNVSGGRTVSFTNTGTNTAIYLILWARVTPSPLPTVDGSNMSLATSHLAATGGSPAASWYFYQFLGSAAGAHSVVYVTTDESLGTVIGCSNAKQSGQPDSATFSSGNSDGSSEVGLGLTTVAPGSYGIGVYESSVNIINTPSSNGTLRNPHDFGVGFVWGSTSDIPGSGSFSLKAKHISGPGVPYSAVGISIAPL